MKPQSYNNHIRFYTPHHFVYYPILIAFLTASIYFCFTKPEKLVWIFISVVFVFLFCLAFMLRQHYALVLQNRIIRLEIRYNYFTLTGNRFEEIEYQFNDSQLYALRFASDDELVSLVEKSIKEKLSSDEIKKAIKNWKPDHERV
ncbi:DUF6526 family protein [Flavobacterium sp.]|uniref:DUF6526 family protein n=1 Tax=Flavobacterium sp. TaxID=239 RepID=UPI003751FB75